MSKGKMSRKKKRSIVVLSTIIGVIALFLIVVFITIETTPAPKKTEDSPIVEELEKDSATGLSKKELEKRVQELEEENKQLKSDVEKYKILAEQTTKAVSSPSVGSPVVTKDKELDSDKKTSDKKTDEKYQDSSKYYDKDYKNYTSDDKSSSGKDKTSSSTSDKKSETSTKIPETSDTGL